jgi:Ni/Co efflux regulator RcnB
MKRPVTLVLVASLLISASAIAGSNGTKSTFKERVATKVAQSESAKRGNDRGHDNRGNDRRHDNDRRDWNDRNDNDRHGRNDHRNDHNRRDWNDNRRDHNRNNWSGHRGWDRPRHDWNNHPNYWDNRRHDRRDHARYRFHFGFYRAPHGYHYRTWHRGDYLPRSYYGSSYIVYDWRPYRLYAPPYGYHWVRVGNDVLLTALATGVVLDVIYDIWY